MANAIIIEPLNITSIAAEGSAAGTTPGNLNNDWIGVVHRGTATTTGAGITFDLGASPQALDTLALLSCASVPTALNIQAGPTFLSTSLYNVTGVPFAAGAVSPVSGRVNMLHMIASPVTARHWGMFLGALPGGAPFEAGRLVAGRRIDPAYNFSFGAAFGVRDLGGGDFSRQGVWLPTPGVRQRTIGLSFARTTRAEIEDLIGPLLERIGNGRFILVVSDTAASAQLQRRMFFGRLEGNLEMIWSRPGLDGFEWRANLVSVI
jgi:hypothetical protein